MINVIKNKNTRHKRKFKNLIVKCLLKTFSSIQLFISCKSVTIHNVWLLKPNVFQSHGNNIVINIFVQFFMYYNLPETAEIFK